MADDLTVEAVFDRRRGIGVPAVHTESYLNSFSEAEWTQLREEATRSGHSENPRLKCGDCYDSVYARASPKGRRHCYHFSGDHSDCRWSNATSRNIRSIDAEKFHGNQESEQHKVLSQFIADVLNLDPETKSAGISFRRYTKAENGQYTYPDVYAETWRNGPAAFEVQLSTTHMPVIVRRQDFYKENKIRLIWIVGFGIDRLNKRAFRDIHMANDGQILGMDGEVVEVVKEAGEPKFRLYRLLPGTPSQGFAPNWHDKIVGPDEINWGALGDKPRSKELSYNQFLNERVNRNKELRNLRGEFYDALKKSNTPMASIAWNKVVKVVGGLSWNQLPAPFHTVHPLGVLATLRTNTLYAPTKISIDQPVNFINSMLLEPLNRRCWTHALELLCRDLGKEELLEAPKVRQKLERNIEELGDAVPIDKRAGPVFNVFFPEGAFFRMDLSGAQDD